MRDVLEKIINLVAEKTVSPSITYFIRENGTELPCKFQLECTRVNNISYIDRKQLRTRYNLETPFGNDSVHATRLRT